MARAVVLAALALVGCSDPPKMRTEAEIKAIANGVASDWATPAMIDGSNAADKINQLQRENDMQERDIDALERGIKSLDDSHDRLLDILAQYEKDGRFN